MVQTRALPSFRVVTSPADSSTATCFLVPVSEIPACAASCPIVASPRPSLSRKLMRVGSARAANVSWTGD